MMSMDKELEKLEKGREGRAGERGDDEEGARWRGSGCGGGGWRGGI